jgi:hypothetical protein
MTDVDPEREIDRMHEAIEDWFTGAIDDLAPFADALAPAFHIVSPDGTTRSREEIVASMAGAHGTSADTEPPFVIDIRNVERRDSAGDHHLVTYEEHQRAGGSWEARTSSAWLREEAAAPGGLAWVHLHETWLE